MANFLLLVVATVSLPLMVFNLLAGCVGAIWLLMLGDWSTALYAFGISLVAPFGLAFPLMLSLVFAVPAMWLFERGAVGKLLASPFLLLSGFVTWAVMAIWGLFVFSQALTYVDGSSVLPYLLVAYSVSVAPWQYMASKEGPEAKVGLPLLFTQLSAIWLIFAVWQKLGGPLDIIIVYLAIMGLGFILSLLGGLTSLQMDQNRGGSNEIG